ncbi:MAG: hypothetical protein E6I44_01395 [Chloroflexi bacterium]|nr:MAG: hypothetical protein E6I44_01395 [Chloroflexota bacterium]
MSTTRAESASLAAEVFPLDAHEREALSKAAGWAALAGITHLLRTAIGPGLYPDWYVFLTALAYGLMLPVIAVLHVRHARVRDSGAVLGTIIGTVVVAIGMGTSAAPELALAALFVRAMWWWTLGKLWWETDVVSRWLGAVTLGLAVGQFALVIIFGPVGADMTILALPLRIALGLWMLALAAVLWRSRLTA